MTGRLIPHRPRVYCVHGEPPDWQAIDAEEHDVWECTECTAALMLVLGRVGGYYWLPDPHTPRRRTWLDRRRRTRQALADGAS